MLVTLPDCWTNGGAKRIVRFWGAKPYYRVRPPKPVLQTSKSGIGNSPASTLKTVTSN